MATVEKIGVGCQLHTVRGACVYRWDPTGMMGRCDRYGCGADVHPLQPPLTTCDRLPVNGRCRTFMLARLFGQKSRCWGQDTHLHPAVMVGRTTNTLALITVAMVWKSCKWAYEYYC